MNSRRLRPTCEDPGKAPKDVSENPEAYRLYLKGRYCWNQNSVKALRKAAAFLERRPSFRSPPVRSTVPRVLNQCDLPVPH